VVDFEFTKVDKKYILLVSGAIANNLDVYKAKQLSGSPIVLKADNKLRMFPKRDYNKVISSVKYIFRTRKNVPRPLLG